MRIRTGRMAVILVVILVAAGCQSQTPQSPGPSGAGPVDSGSPRETAAAPSTPSTPPTSESLIAAALASGKITYEQSLLDRALALYDSPALPSEFRSPVADTEAAADLLGEIDLKESTLSTDLLAKLAPYRARPSDPISIFNQAPAAAGAVPVAGAGVVVAAASVPWQSLPAAGGKARVWVKAATAADAADDLTQRAAAVSRVWDAFPGIFTYPNPDMAAIPTAAINPDGAIDFYFIDIGSLDPRRQTCASNPTDESCTVSARKSGFAAKTAQFTGNRSSGYVVLDAAVTGPDELDKIAHELAHTAQYAYDMNESSWLKESTATWVAYKVDQKLSQPIQYQYGWLPNLFRSLDKTLTRETDDNAYASWLYFQFASMEKGDGVVTEIWKVAAADGVQGAKAADQVFPFADHFDKFAVRNWNEDPVKPQYKTADATFPGYGPTLQNSVKTLEGGQKASLNMNLAPLAASYFQYDFTPTVRDVTFDNNLQGYADARVWAIKTIAGKDQPPEDWTLSAKKRFCRNIPEQDVTRIVLIVSNVSMTDSLSDTDPSKMTAGSTGCSGWTGTMKATETWDVDGGHGTATSTFTGTWTIDVEGDAQCPANSPDGCVLLRPSGTIDWTWDSHHSQPKCDETNTGTKAANTEKFSDQQYLYMRPVDKDHIQYWGQGGFETPGYNCINLILIGGAPPAFFEIDERSSAAQPPDGTGGTCYHKDWQIDTNGTTMSGSCISYKYEHSFASFEWNLTRIGP